MYSKFTDEYAGRLANMKQLSKSIVLRQSLVIMLLTLTLVSCAPGVDNPLDGVFDSFFGQPAVEEVTNEVTELAPEEQEVTSSQPVIVEVVETPIDQLEQTLMDAQTTSESEGSVLNVVTLEESTSSEEATTDSNTSESSESNNAETESTETSTSTDDSASTFTTTPVASTEDGEDPEALIIEFTNVDSIKEDASLSNFFAAGPHALLAMRDEDEMVGIATLSSDGTLSLRTDDVLQYSRPADETFVGCLDVIREFSAGAAVYGGVSFFESITVPGLVLTPVLDVNSDESYIPAVNYVRLTDPLLVSGTCFEFDNAVEYVQASFVPGWNRLLREIDWRDIARGNTAAQDSDIQKTLWSVNNNSETVVKWLYSRP